MKICFIWSFWEEVVPPNNLQTETEFYVQFLQSKVLSTNNSLLVKKDKENWLNHKRQLLAVYKKKKKFKFTYKFSQITERHNNFHNYFPYFSLQSMISFALQTSILSYWPTGESCCTQMNVPFKSLAQKSITRNEKSRHSCLRYFFEAKPNHKLLPQSVSLW